MVQLRAVRAERRANEWDDSAHPRVLIIGDGEAALCGVELRARLIRKGYNVLCLATPGATIAKIANKLATASGDARDKPLGLAVVFAGANDQAGPQLAADAERLLRLLPAEAVLWVGPTPATRIGNLAAARELYGKRVQSQAHWFESGVATQRELVNAQLAELLGPLGYVDPRQLQLGGAEQDSGVRFPQLEDGLHMRGAVAAGAADGIAGNVATTFIGVGKDLRRVAGRLAVAAAVVAAVAIALCSCSGPQPLQDVVHVTTYQNGQSDIVERRLLFRGQLAPNTVAATLARFGLAADATITTGD